MLKNGVCEHEDNVFDEAFTDLKKFEFEGKSFFIPQHIVNEKYCGFKKHLESYSESVFQMESTLKRAEVLFVEKKQVISKKKETWNIYTIDLRDLENNKLFYPCRYFVKMGDAENNEDTKQKGKEEAARFEEVFQLEKKVVVELKKPRPQEYIPIERTLPRFSIKNDYASIKGEEFIFSFPSRTELFARTNMSQLESILSTKDIIMAGEDSAFKTIGICDTGGFYSLLSLEKLSKKKGVRVIYGVCLFVEGLREPERLIFYPNNTASLREMYKVYSSCWDNGTVHGSPILKWDDVVNLRAAGVKVIMPTFRGGIMHDSLAGKENAIVDNLNKVDGVVISPLAHHNIYWELPENNYSCSDTKVRDIIFDIIKEARIKKKNVFFSNYPSAINAEQQEVLDMILFSERREDFSKAPKYFLTDQEMKEHFKEFISFCGETFFNECINEAPILFSMDLDEIKVLEDGLFLPKMPDCRDENAELRKLTKEGMSAKYGEDWETILPSNIIERINFELDSITKKYSVIYLASLRAIEFSRSLGYPVGSRGSVGSSVVAHAIGVSEVNPLPPHYHCNGCFKHVNFDSTGKNISCGWDLPPKQCPVCGKELIRDGFAIEFSSFMGYDGSKVADIDLNFSGVIQKDVMSYLSETLFCSSAYRVGTVMCLQKMGLEKTLSSFLGCNEAKNNYFSSVGAGMRKSFGKHAGGLIVIPLDRNHEDFTPLNMVIDSAGEKSFTTHYEFELIHDTLLKMDILASDSIEFLYLLGKTTGVDHEKIDFFSKDVLELFKARDTLGVNEFTTHNAMRMVEEIKPTQWNHLCSMSGLQHGTGVWEGNAREIILSGRATIDEIDGCRDDIVSKLSHWLGSFEDAYNIVESVRKGKGVPQKYQKITREKVPEWYYDFIDKIQYMFPKAHAAAYLVVSAKQAWFKIHYPAHFYCAYLSMKMRKSKLIKDTWLFLTREELDEEIEALMQEKNQKRAVNKMDREKKIIICEVLKEIKDRGFEILLPHPNFSDATEFIPQDGKIRAPLTTIPGTGFLAAQGVVEERNNYGTFSTPLDLYKRTEIPHNSMIRINSYGNFGKWNEKDKEKGDKLRKSLRNNRKNSKMYNGLLKFKKNQ